MSAARTPSAPTGPQRGPTVLTGGVCQYLQGDAVEVECGRAPVVAVWRRDQSTARLCDRHDRRAQKQLGKHPDAGWMREAL